MSTAPSRSRILGEHTNIYNTITGVNTRVVDPDPNSIHTGNKLVKNVRLFSYSYVKILFLKKFLKLF